MSDKNKINGKKLQFGNTEQIKYLKQFEKGFVPIKNPVHTKETKTKFYLKFWFECLNCGEKTGITLENEDNNDFQAYCVTCFSCDADYELKDNKLILKL